MKGKQKQKKIKNKLRLQNSLSFLSHSPLSARKCGKTKFHFSHSKRKSIAFLWIDNIFFLFISVPSVFLRRIVFVYYPSTWWIYLCTLFFEFVIEFNFGSDVPNAYSCFVLRPIRCSLTDHSAHTVKQWIRDIQRHSSTFLHFSFADIYLHRRACVKLIVEPNEISKMMLCFKFLK